MIYVTGDTHGDFTRFQQPELKKLKKGDTLLICGDFGFLWDGSKAEQRILKKLGKMKYQICFIDGAHENFELLLRYPLEEWNGGQARVISGRLRHLARGQIFTIEGKTVFTMGGGVSPDDDLRAYDPNRMRWEIPSREELAEATRTLEQAGGKVDYIVTHEPPLKIKGFLQLKSGIHTTEATGLNTYFEELGKVVRFSRWFFGSMHTDKYIASTHISLFRKIVRADQ
ncbi:MAG: metallophosphoesterase [Oscillospiraceae bacterium]|jgi:predicted phosphodiesterase|nr:metallophosphoesterase [Oscillospiraceae bacterium]